MRFLQIVFVLILCSLAWAAESDYDFEELDSDSSPRMAEEEERAFESEQNSPRALKDSETGFSKKLNNDKRPQFIIKSMSSGRVLDGSFYEVFAKIYTKKSSQKWHLNRVGTDSYIIVNCESGRALTLTEPWEVPGTIRPVVTKKAMNTQNQRWSFYTDKTIRTDINDNSPVALALTLNMFYALSAGKPTVSVNQKFQAIRI